MCAQKHIHNNEHSEYMHQTGKQGKFSKNTNAKSQI